MISQVEIQDYAKLKAEQKAIADRMETMRAMLIARRGEEQERGLLRMKFTPADKPVTKWKAVVERVKELHPEMAGNIASIELANRKMSEGVFELSVEVG